LLCKVFDAQDKRTYEFISDTYDRHAILITDVVREMLIDLKRDTEVMILSIVAEQNKAIFTKIDEQNKIIKEIQKVLTAQQKELNDHEKRIRVLEKKLADLLTEHNNHHK
jgi:uncharacterized coiled-coil protein SlyX